VGVWLAVVVDVVAVVGATPPVVALVVVSGALWVVVGGAVCVVVADAVTGAVVLVTAAAAGVLGADVAVAAVEVDCLDPPQAVTARTVRTAMAAFFIGPR
jgi:hypothetical protein